MKKIFTFLISVLCFFTLGALPNENLQTTEHITVMLIVDNSGSMKTSDSQGLRFTGARLFASLLDVGDSFGFIIFSTESDVQTDGIITIESREVSAKFSTSINAQAADGYTDVKAALEDAKELLEDKEPEDEKVIIVLLTDGKPEVQNSYLQYEQETLDLARSLKIPVIAIALTSAAQTPFLNQLATVTKGTVIPAENSSDLLNNYLRVLGQIKDRTVIGGERFKSSSSLEIEQTLAPYVNSATFVFAKSETAKIHLLGPDGNEIEKYDSSDPRFSLFTLENPVGGVYTFRVQGEGEVQAWAILRSRLRVQIMEPVSVHPLGRDLPVVVNLLEETTTGNFVKIIGAANFSALITAPDGSAVSLDRFYDDGTHGDITADDGNYTRLFPAPKVEGFYLIAVQGWKNAIPVQTETQVKVMKFPKLIVDTPAIATEVRGNAIDLQVHLDMPTSIGQGEVVAQITTPSGKADEITLSGEGIYTGELLPLEDGEYHINFELRNATIHRVSYQTNIERDFNVLVIPFVNLSLKEIVVPIACFSSSNEISILLSALSSGAETLQFSAPNDWQVTPQSLKVEQGKQNIQLKLLAPDGLSEGLYRVDLLIEGRDSLEVQPEALIGLDIQIPGLYARCRTPINFGLGILLFVVIGGVSIQRARKSALPSPVCGTLRHWAIGENPAAAMEIDLTAYGKASLLLGSGAACDVMIPHAGLASEHVRVVTEKTPDGVGILLEPIGEVRKGYSQQSVHFVLHHGETFRMGTHEFQFLSDSGE